MERRADVRSWREDKGDMRTLQGNSIRNFQRAIYEISARWGPGGRPNVFETIFIALLEGWVGGRSWFLDVHMCVDFMADECGRIAIGEADGTE